MWIYTFNSSNVSISHPNISINFYINRLIFINKTNINENNCNA